MLLANIIDIEHLVNIDTLVTNAFQSKPADDKTRIIRKFKHHDPV